jgi:hypothetical protein
MRQVVNNLVPILGPCGLLAWILIVKRKRRVVEEREIPMTRKSFEHPQSHGARNRLAKDSVFVQY